MTHNLQQLHQVSPQLQSYLLQTARQAIEYYLNEGSCPHYESANSELNSRFGVFVTLRIFDGQKLKLRGCIGRIEAEDPLIELVPQMAIKAATQDPRFPPLAKEELPHLHIEISILSPVLRLKNPEMIELGKDGLLIEGNGRRGLLLPEVPLVQGWNRRQYLEGICQKAGLPPDFWHHPRAKLYQFNTQVFEDAV